MELATDLHLSHLIFLNNTSLRTGQAVCLRFSASQAVSIDVLNSTFVGNRGFQNTIASVTGVRNFRLVNVVAENNTARGSTAGVALYPYTGDDSFFQVVDCVFRGNSGSSYGVLLVTDPFGMAFSKAYKLKLEVRNTRFEQNFAKIGGSSVTISGSVFLSTASSIVNASFIGNECTEGGAAVNSHYLAGAIHLYSCLFRDNKGSTGAAIWSTHQGESTLLYLTSCEFEGNQGNSVVAMTAIGSQLISNENNFTGSIGTAVLIYQSIWQDSNSLYSNNAGYNAGAVLLSTSSQARLSNATIHSNSAVNQGGGFTVWISSTLTCSDCVFLNNSCGLRGGALFLEEKSGFNGTNVTFWENKSGDRGSVLFALLSNFACVFCLFERNYAAEFAAVFILGAEASIEKSRFAHNQASRSSPGIMLSLASLTVLNCTFFNHTGDQGSFISASDQSYLYISWCEFLSGHAKTHGGCFYLTVNSTLIVENTLISSCSAQLTGSIIRGRTGTILFQKVTIRNVTSDLGSGAIALAEGYLELEIDCADMLGSAVSASSSVVLVHNSHFLGLRAYNGAAISVSDCSLLTVRFSAFTGGLAKRGGAIYAFSSGANVSNQVSIINSTFTDNQSVNGGAIYTDSVFAYVQNCRFTNNSVSPEYYDSREILLRGQGAALYLVNPNIVVAVYRVIGNVFERNAASYMGAALYWFDTYPLFENNTLEGNSAPYGSEIAAFAIRLAILTPNNTLVNYQNAENPPLVLTLPHVGSGQTYEGVIRLALVDQYDKVVTADSTSSANLQVIEKNSSSLTGYIKTEAISGIFELKDTIFIGQPKSTQYFLISTNGVNPYLKVFTTDPHDYYQTVKLAVEFRDCQAGESYQGLICYRCPAGTFSLDPVQPCNSCPAQATCLGGFEMVPLPGFWRPDPMKNLFLACPNPDACLGSPSAESISLAGICAVGYRGNLCSVCMEGYSRQGRDVCSKCPGLTSNIVVSTLVVVGALCLLALAIAISVRGANKPRSHLAIYVKIFMNYLQMIVVAASLSLSWPALVRLFLNGQETVGSMAEQLFSFDCITQEFSPDRVSSTKLIAVSLLPAVLILLSAFAWAVIALCFKQTAIRAKVISSTVMILFLIHPSLTKLMLSDFSCREVLPGELWLTVDLAQRCWDSAHVREVLTVVLPGLIVWGFGLPALALGFLVKCRAQLTDKVISLEFSFLYKGYTEKWFYWEFVILYRKVALICSAVFFNSVSTLVQALSVLAVLLICLFLQLAVSPFAVSNFNLLEVKSLLVSLVTIYSGLYFEANSMNHTLNILIFLLILLANAYFLLGWLRAVLPILLETIRQRLNCGKRHYAIRPIPAKYDESMDESSGVSKGTGTHQLGLSEVRAI